ncbi:MAG: hypothetical protein R3B13_11885 [Polyangiaceae bacterium]
MKRLGYLVGLAALVSCFPSACSSDSDSGGGTGGAKFDGGGATGGFGNFGGTGGASGGASGSGGSATGGASGGANDSCAGICGSTNPAPGPQQCYCDADCVTNGDCCDDAYTECGGSCVGKCGASDTSGTVECYCSSDCVGFGDCCKDYATVCDTDAGTGGTGGTDAGTGGASGGTGGTGGTGGASGGSGGTDAGTGGASGGTGGTDAGTGGTDAGTGGTDAGTGGASGGTGGTDAGSGGTDGGTAAAVWVNELHYDNTGTDTDEGVEIAGPAGTNLTGYSLVFYNGSPTQLTAYGTDTLSGTIPNQQNGYGTLWFPHAGIQNGNSTQDQPDGFALVDDLGKVLYFLSYEGSFTAADGAAQNLTSTDIGVFETEAGTAAGQSLQLTGTGHAYSAFTWAAPAAHTRGLVNTGQTLQ